MMTRMKISGRKWRIMQNPSVEFCITIPDLFHQQQAHDKPEFNIFDPVLSKISSITK